MKIDGKIKAKGARFVRFYPSDWRSGCLGLSLEQEGLYVRICAFIYETNRRLPIDDCAAAKFMGAHTNAYRKVRDQLVELGKVSRCADGYTVDRAERELEAAIGSSPSADQEGAVNGPAHTIPERETRQDTLGDTPLDTPPDTRGVFSEKVYQFNGPSIEPKANSQEKVDAGESVADRLARQAHLRGLETKAGKTAKSARAIQRTKGELDGSRGITLIDGKLTVVNGSAATLAEEFPGIDLTAVCNRAAPDLSKTPYPSYGDAMAILRKWAQIVVGDKASGRFGGQRNVHPADIPHVVSPDTIRFAKPARYEF